MRYSTEKSTQNHFESVKSVGGGGRSLETRPPSSGPRHHSWARERTLVSSVCMPVNPFMEQAYAMRIQYRRGLHPLVPGRGRLRYLSSCRQPWRQSSGQRWAEPHGRVLYSWSPRLVYSLCMRSSIDKLHRYMSLGWSRPVKVVNETDVPCTWSPCANGLSTRSRTDTKREQSDGVRAKRLC